MHLLPYQNRNERGSVLLTALVLCVILGLTLSGYLYWVRTQNVLVAQSQAWNAALAHAEAGVEEAMAQLNVTFGTNYHSSAATNWGGSVGSAVYGPRSHWFANGAYSAIIRPSDLPEGPVIISTGYAVVPIVGRVVSRTVEVKARSNAAFGDALAAIQNITMNGNPITIDSYDSFDPNHSTNGVYDAARPLAGGDVSSVGGVITVGNAVVHGRVQTSPYGSAGTGPSGAVGDLSWAGPGIQQGWYRNDYNAEYPPVTPPFDPTTALSVPAAVGGVITLGSGDYFVGGDFTIPNNTTLQVDGNARLWVQGNFRMVSPSGSFLNIGIGAMLKMYVGTETGPNVSADFSMINNGGNAYNFQYYGLPSNVAVTWGGNDEYVGTVYAPQAAFTLNGSGATAMDYQGSVVARSITLNGRFNIHYDENLGRRGPPTGYIAYSWRELPPPQSVVSAPVPPTTSASLPSGSPMVP
jgi:hypothetical protein